MRGTFGWDLPPGCSVSDIPGNRPEDEAWEKVINDFWDEKRFTKEEWAISENLDDVINDIIEKAIVYGMELGRKDQKSIWLYS